MHHWTQSPALVTVCFSFTGLKWTMCFAMRRFYGATEFVLSTSTANMCQGGCSVQMKYHHYLYQILSILSTSCKKQWTCMWIGLIIFVSIFAIEFRLLTCITTLLIVTSFARRALFYQWSLKIVVNIRFLMWAVEEIITYSVFLSCGYMMKVLCDNPWFVLSKMENRRENHFHATSIDK